MNFFRYPLIFLTTGLALWLTGCATSGPPAPQEMVYAVTERMELIRFRSDRPAAVLERRALSGLAPGDSLRGIDYRVARGVLFTLADSGRLYTLDTAQARLSPVAAAAPQPWPVQGQIVGFDFNPTVDRIRVVSSTAQNLRLHPETNAVVDGNPSEPGLQLDGALHYVMADRHAGRQPVLSGVAYSYNNKDEKITTNYAIDRALGALLMQGSFEGAVPVISPNTGQLRTVGLLGTGPLDEAHFDISDVRNTALVSARRSGERQTRLYQLDLGSGRARDLGMIAGGERLLGLAIEP